MNPHACADEDRWAKCRYRRFANFVALIEEIFRGNENIQTAGNSTQDQGVEREIATKPEKILIIVKLRTRNATLKTHGRECGSVESCLKGKLMPSDLRNHQSFKCLVGRKPDHSCICK